MAVIRVLMNHFGPAVACLVVACDSGSSVVAGGTAATTAPQPTAQRAASYLRVTAEELAQEPERFLNRRIEFVDALAYGRTSYSTFFGQTTFHFEGEHPLASPARGNQVCSSS